MKTLFQSRMGSLLVIVVVALCLGCGASSQVQKVESAQNKSVQQIQALQEQTVGKIPCRADEIEIPEHKINRTDGSGYWIAYCLGKTYKCVRGKDNPNVTCEQIPAQLME